MHRHAFSCYFLPWLLPDTVYTIQAVVSAFQVSFVQRYLVVVMDILFPLFFDFHKFFRGDDYIVKPFSLAELEARVRAHLRREARHSFETQIKFSGDLTINYSECCLFFADKRVGLAKKEFDIVELLSQNPGQVFDNVPIGSS